MEAKKLKAADPDFKHAATPFKRWRRESLIRELPIEVVESLGNLERFKSAFTSDAKMEMVAQHSVRIAESVDEELSYNRALRRSKFVALMKKIREYYYFILAYNYDYSINKISDMLGVDKLELELYY